MISSIILIMLAVQNPVVQNYDPPPAEYWKQVVEFRCGGSTLRIAGYGAGMPVTGSAKITVNGEPLKGAKVSALQQDLSSRGAVYRLGARCSKPTHEIGLAIDTGEKTAEGQLVFRNGVAMIKDGSLVQYSGLGQSNAESFWFR